MDETKSVAILSALAQGVNPLTGEIFEPDSPYQHADVVHALHFAVERMRQSDPSHQGTKARSRSAERSNVGKPWTEAEDERLLAEFDRGRTPSEVARDLGRTLAGVEARLEKHGRLSTQDRKTANRYPTARAAQKSSAN